MLSFILLIIFPLPFSLSVCHYLRLATVDDAYLRKMKTEDNVIPSPSAAYTSPTTTTNTETETETEADTLSTESESVLDSSLQSEL